MKLYEISEELNNAVAELEGLGLTEEEKADSLAAIRTEYDQKMDNFIAWIKGLRAEEEAYREEAKKLMAKAETTKSKRNWAQEVVTANLQSTGADSVGSGIHTAKLRKPQKVAVVDDESQITMRYFTEVPASLKLDKLSLLADLKAGEEIEGAHLEDGKVSLIIK